MHVRICILRYLIQFLLFCSFVDCGDRVSSRIRVSVSFIFLAFFPFRCTLKERKLAPGQVPPWLSGSVFRLFRFDSPAMIILFKVSIQLVLARYFWPLESRHFVSI